MSQNNGAPTYIKQTLVNRKIQIDPNKIILVDFNTLLSTYRSSKLKLSKDPSELKKKNATNKMNLTDIYKLFSAIVKQTHFLCKDTTF